MPRASAKHRASGRRSTANLDARDLINLPLPDPVPLVNTILGPLLDNGAAQPSTSPNPQPAPTPDAVSGNGSGDGSGDGNGTGDSSGSNSSGGGSGGGTSGGGTSGGSSGGGSSGNGSGGSSGEDGSGGGGGNGGGSAPTPTASPASGGGTAVPPASIVPNPTSPPVASGKSSSPSGVNGTSSGGSVVGSSSQGGGGNIHGTDGSSMTTPAVFSVSSPFAMGSLAPSQYSSGGFDAVGTASPSSTLTSTTVSSGKQLSGGAIAGIAIACLFSLLALIILVVRRRSIARRLEIRRHWWFGRHNSNGNFLLVNGSGEAPPSRLSARSSFATNFDQGLMLRVDPPQGFSPGVVPDFPSMAQVRERNSVLISTGGAAARRESLNSMLSNGSDPDTPYLTVPTSQNNLEPTTPMSVRPFSPSESFAFPKPPAPPSSTPDSFFISGTQGPTLPRSSATLVYLSAPPRAFITDLPPTSVSVPSPPPSPTTANPSIDPFADPVKPGFADIEVVRRPFTPSLDDELAVRMGDRVHLLQVFDDGWAFAEKLDATKAHHERGLIPVECLREASQALPTILAQKRLSSGPDQLMAVAL